MTVLTVSDSSRRHVGHGATALVGFSGKQKSCLWSLCILLISVTKPTKVHTTLCAPSILTTLRIMGRRLLGRRPSFETRRFIRRAGVKVLASCLLYCACFYLFWELRSTRVQERQWAWAHYFFVVLRVGGPEEIRSLVSRIGSYASSLPEETKFTQLITYPRWRPNH